MTVAAEATSNRHAVSVHVGGARVALSAADILEILRRPTLTRVPNGPAALQGLAKLRGAATPVFCLATMLGQPHPREKGWVIVLNRTPGLALLVDRVESISEQDDVAPGEIQVALGDERSSKELGELFDGLTAPDHERPTGKAVDLSGTDTGQNDEATVGFLSIMVAGQKYALPLSDIVEVAQLPTETAIGASRSAPIGRATIRGNEMELVSLATLLGFEGIAVSGHERVVVVEREGRRTGLVVGGARTILRVAEASIGAPPFLLNRENDRAAIQSVLRMPDGRGVVSVLTTNSLFGQQVANTDGTQTLEIVENDRAAMADSASRFVIFRVGRQRYGYPIEAIAEIGRCPETISPVPGAPAYIAGAINFRGSVIAIIDQRQRFGAAAPADGASRIIFVSIDGVQTGLLVDEVSDIRHVDPSQIDTAPELRGPSSGLFDRVIGGDQDEEMILVVNPERLFDRAELDRLAEVSGAREAARL